jgi:hypothetical protein
MREVLRRNVIVITLRTVIRQFNLLITMHFFVLQMVLGGVSRRSAYEHPSHLPSFSLRTARKKGILRR